jgi:formate-dependent nitrite reductase membrane component NrfD
LTAVAAAGDQPAGIRSYHGQPVLKRPVWSWEIPDYFFVGGMAGASAGLAFCSGARGNDVLARRAWTVALAGITVSPALLISDLGRPERFLNMLRMVKVTSPMNVGTWVLSGAGGAITFAAADAWTGRFPRVGRIARPVAALFGLPLSTYTGALLANTAVPVWHEARRTLPFVFGSGAALSAGAAATVFTPVVSASPARRLALGAAVAELATSGVMEVRLGEHGQPYRRGASARFTSLSRACLASGASLLARRGRSSRAAAVASGALLLAGALAARWSVFEAGIQSASDPKYVIAPQRSAIERGERRGAARREPGRAV